MRGILPFGGLRRHLDVTDLAPGGTDGTVAQGYGDAPHAPRHVPATALKQKAETERDPERAWSNSPRCRSAVAPVLRTPGYLAGAAAVQSILLATHSRGPDACWRTADRCRYPEVPEWFGPGGRDEGIGLVYVGWPIPDRPT